MQTGISTPVAQVGNLLCRRLAVGGNVPTLAAAADCQSATPQTASLRYVTDRPVQGEGFVRLNTYS